MRALRCTPALAVLALAPLSAQDTSESAWSRLIERAERDLGPAGEAAAEFLAEHRPERDAELSDELLWDNLRLALEARERFPWAKELSDELFLNDVLPYAVLDETRESWRPKLLEITAPIVAECKTATEAAQAINAKLFHAIEVHYNTGRKRPNASPSESIAQGRATCTGLTILYVDACRSVGIPARAAGVRLWHDDRGNHTWPEMWDGERWRFTGADEYDAKGLDRGWFVSDASKAVAGDLNHAVWATTWKRTGTHFPLAWNRADKSVAAVDVTSRYRKDDDSAAATLAALGANDEPLGEEAADRVQRAVWELLRAELAEELKAEDEAHAFRVGEHELRLKERKFGDEPKSLWISMHGGGGAPKRVNDGQWENQIKLYEPEEGWYVAPRAPTDTWNLWHQGHIDPLFERMIASYVVRRGVDPNRVYLMGYSAGGDGVFQLAPRMADRFAAAAMMAGHPNETQPDGLRNLPFALFMGGEDKAYGRSDQAHKWRDMLTLLDQSDAGGYDHFVRIYEGKGHWMDREDAEALPWMAEKRRRTWPQRVVWLQDDVVHDRAYWLSVDPAKVKGRPRIEAHVDGATIAISTVVDGTERAEGIDEITLRLHDRLLDLDKDVRVTWNGAEVWSGKPERRRSTIEADLRRTRDPALAATCTLAVRRP